MRYNPEAMEFKVKKLPKSSYEIEVVVPVQEVEKEYNQALKLFSESVEIEGFRKGKAPANLVVDRVGIAELKKQILERLLGHYFPEVLKQANLSSLSNPEIRVTQFDLRKDLEFVASFSALPEVEVVDYEKIIVRKEKPKEIKDGHVEEALNSVFQDWLKKNKPQETPNIIYGAGGEVLLSGRPSPDDNFAQKLFAKDLPDLKRKINQELQVQEDYRVEKDFENRVLEEVLKRTNTEVPEVLIEDELNRMTSRLHLEVNALGGNFEDFLKSQGKDLKGLRESWRDAAEKNVKLDLALTEIALLEKIEVSDQEVKDQLKNHPPQEHSEEERERELSFIRYALKQTKTLNRLKEIASQ